MLTGDPLGNSWQPALEIAVAFRYVLHVYELAFSKKALTALRRMPANEQRRIRARIDDYAADPQAHARQARKLKGREGYRLRVGRWRAIFDVQDNVMHVLDVGPRGSIYE